MSSEDDEPALKNPVWSAFSGQDRSFSVGTDLARRYVPEVGPFAAVANERDPRAWAELAPLVGREGVALFSATPPQGWEEIRTIPATQMIWNASVPLENDGWSFVSLTASDSDSMLALTRKTAPGPFEPLTVELGGYRGLWDNGELICMGGERMHPGRWTEISAISTHPRHTGRGLGTSIVKSLIRDIVRSHRQPFLHVMSQNTRAHDLYKRIGFIDHAQVAIRVLRPLS